MRSAGALPVSLPVMLTELAMTAELSFDLGKIMLQIDVEASL